MNSFIDIDKSAMIYLACVFFFFYNNNYIIASFITIVRLWIFHASLLFSGFIEVEDVVLCFVCEVILSMVSDRPLKNLNERGKWFRLGLPDPKVYESTDGIASKKY